MGVQVGLTAVRGRDLDLHHQQVGLGHIAALLAALQKLRPDFIELERLGNAHPAYTCLMKPLSSSSFTRLKSMHWSTFTSFTAGFSEETSRTCSTKPSR